MRGHTMTAQLSICRPAIHHSRHQQSTLPVLHFPSVLPARRVLFDAGADINSADSRGITLMHTTAKLGREDVVMYIAHDRHSLPAPYLQPHSSHTALRVICYLVSFLQSHGVSIDARDSAGRTAVHYCSEHGHITILNRLLAAGFSPRTLDAAQWTPLHFACLGEWPMHESHALITAALLSHGADVNASEMSGLRPLHVCTDTPAARLVVAAGAEIEAMDLAGRRAIHYASHENTIMLVQHGAQVQPADKSARDRTTANAPMTSNQHRSHCSYHHIVACCSV